MANIIDNIERDAIQTIQFENVKNVADGVCDWKEQK